MSFQMVEINDQVENWYQANVNGGEYDIPAGQWVHFRWQYRVATEGSGSKNGYIHGWVNGTQRWDYNNIYTAAQGQVIDSIELNATFNNTVYGPNNIRYYDLFSVKTIKRHPGGESQ